MIAACVIAATVVRSSMGLSVGDIFVDANAVNCATGSGLRTDPVCSIGEAITLASSGDTIRVAAGVYVESVTLDKDLDLVGTDGASVTVVQGVGSGSVIVVEAMTTVTIDQLTITETPLSGAAEGVLVRSGSDLTIANSTINGISGRGLRALMGGATQVVIDSCRVVGNGSGGVYVRDTNLTILDTTISNNYGFLGGGIRMFGGALVMTGSTVSYNDASVGGGMYCDGTTFEITNSTVSHNQAMRIGGIAFYAGPNPKQLTSVTVVENRGDTSTRPSGIYGEALPLLLSHTIVADNSGPLDVSGSVIFEDHNLIGRGLPGGSSANGNMIGTPTSPISALTGPLQDHGGPTETHALLLGSPAIDRGDVASSALVDQRGIARVAGPSPDIGAYEFEIAEVSFCSGDGGNQLGCTPCPCGNNAAIENVGGCLNSAGSSAELHVSGSLSVSLPTSITSDLRFSVLGIAPNKFCVLTSGDAVAPTNPASPCNGMQSGVRAIAYDGLRCAVLNQRRHGGRAADSNGDIGLSNDPWGGEGGPPVGIAQSGSGFSAGQVRYFQAIYRDDADAVCMRGLNTSQAVEVSFVP